MMYNWYSRLSVQIKWNNKLSTKIRVSVGTRQGGLSTLLWFNLFYEGLTRLLSDCGGGIRINNDSYNVFCYADDLILSLSVIGLQELIAKVGEYNFCLVTMLGRVVFFPPKLFSVYVDELSKKLSAAKTGCIINDISINHVFYADDLCMMSASLSGLQKLIDICFEYSLHNSLTFNSTKSVCIVFKPKRFKLHCPTMTLNSVSMEYVTDVKYLGFMFTSDSKDDVDMQKQLRTFYAHSNTILRQFAKCDESVKLELFRSFCTCYYCPYLWLDMTKHSTMKLRVAYNNARRKILKLHMRGSASQMYVDNNLLNFEALIRIKTNTFISRLTVSDNTIIEALLDNRVAKVEMWNYWYSHLY